MRGNNLSFSGWFVLNWIGLVYEFIIIIFIWEKKDLSFNVFFFVVERNKEK